MSGERLFVSGEVADVSRNGRLEEQREGDKENSGALVTKKRCKTWIFFMKCWDEWLCLAGQMMSERDDVRCCLYRPKEFFFYPIQKFLSRAEGVLMWLGSGGILVLMGVEKAWEEGGEERDPVSDYHNDEGCCSVCVRRPLAYTLAGSNDAKASQVFVAASLMHVFRFFFLFSY